MQQKCHIVNILTIAIDSVPILALASLLFYRFQSLMIPKILFHSAVFTTESNTEDDDGDFVTYMLIYFFITLGSLLLLTVIVLSVAIVVLKMRSRTPKDTPLLSEDEKIAVMKQSGYVNPTYKFFDNVNEV